MSMDGSTLEAEIASAGVQLAVLASKNVASSVANRFQAIRAKKSIEEACNSYEEIINDLIPSACESSPSRRPTRRS